MSWQSKPAGKAGPTQACLGSESHDCAKQVNITLG